ncbi:hypothetical protein KAK06_03255 [Ideonella sp. 4Y11]|uniref:Alginate export domain-containing protein n=1 Tax=Ideonella aquatica TaxID=2824119 RepID=A0A940YL30_9BURK|nr:hypothetical protein [Ideonella aquatica]MBQ0957968.1 hypothetical protein [Ideonella aquatica]
MRALFMLMLLSLAQGPARALDEAAALDLADQAPALATGSGTPSWQGRLELAQGWQRSPDGGHHHGSRVSLVARHDRSLGDGWRGVLDDRLDLSRADRPAQDASVHSLREAYVGYAPDDQASWEFGRINLRGGLAQGYSPVDYFRASAVRFQVPGDPTQLKSERLGSVALRLQQVWPQDALELAYVPRIGGGASEAVLDPDWGRTNASERLLVRWTHDLGQGLRPQASLLHEAGRPLRLGLGLSTVVGEASVAYLDWSGSRVAAALDQAAGLAGTPSFHQQFSLGWTYTTAQQVGITLEYDRDNAAPDSAEWAALRAAPGLGYGRYRQWAQQRQELVTRSGWFLRVTASDVLTPGLGLTLIARRDQADRSAFLWGELRYRWSGQVDLALQAQATRGGPTTNYGAAPDRRAWQFTWTGYF